MLVSIPFILVGVIFVVEWLMTRWVSYNGRLTSNMRRINGLKGKKKKKE